MSKSTIDWIKVAQCKSFSEFSNLLSRYSNELPMKPEEFKNRMSELYMTFKDDVKVCHSKMDDLMCELLRTLGYDAGVEIFEKAER